MLNVFQSVSPTAQVLLAVTLLWLAGFGMSRITKLLHLPNVTGTFWRARSSDPMC